MISSQETLAVLAAEKKYLMDEGLMEELKLMAKELPQETVMEAPSILSTMIKDHIEELFKYQPIVVQKALSIRLVMQGFTVISSKMRSKRSTD